MKQNIPKESIEQEILVKRLEFHKYKFWAVRNESDWRNIRKWTIRKKSWVQKWIPDLWIIIKSWGLLAIELKRQRRVLKNGNLWASPSSVSPEQKYWIEELNKIKNVQAEICYGAEHSIETIQRLEKAD